MPVEFLFLLKMPFNSEFQVVLGASDIDIKTRLKIKGAKFSYFNTLIPDYSHNQAIDTFIENIVHKVYSIKNSLMIEKLIITKAGISLKPIILDNPYIMC